VFLLRVRSSQTSKHFHKFRFTKGLKAFKQAPIPIEEVKAIEDEKGSLPSATVPDAPA
jgi:hypothetical protein